MSDKALLKDLVYSEKKVVSPYRQLRELRGLSMEKAAEIFGCSYRTIWDIENGVRDASKQLIRKMDAFYGCKGGLIEYWLTKYSAHFRMPETKAGDEKMQKKSQGFWDRLGALKNFILH